MIIILTLFIYVSEMSAAIQLSCLWLPCFVPFYFQSLIYTQIFVPIYLFSLSCDFTSIIRLVQTLVWTQLFCFESALF